MHNTLVPTKHNTLLEDIVFQCKEQKNNCNKNVTKLRDIRLAYLRYTLYLFYQILEGWFSMSNGGVAFV